MTLSAITVYLRRGMTRRVVQMLLAALVLDVLSWPPLLAGVLVAEATLAPRAVAAELPAPFWPAVLVGQYVGWVAIVAIADAIAARRRAPRPER